MEYINDEGRDDAPPIKEGEEFNVEIESIGKSGDGIAKIQNFVIFIKDTQKGDKIKVRITKVMKSYSFGEVVEKLD